jgi:tRNA(Ile)-lysidine synthase
MVLLHLMRFHHGSGRELRVAHMDHGMRAGSSADRDWVRGVCRAWEVPCSTRSADPVPGSEAAAREARYAFLRSVQAETGAAAILTAHHADDQAETVLFRILRGTGLRGLRGMGPSRDGIVRPLLGWWRKDLERYAAVQGVPFRRDPTNLALEYRRNRRNH